MSKRSETPYGEWPSPLSATRLTEGALRLGEPWLDNGQAYWLEGRAEEGGRNVIVRAGTDGRIEDLLPQPFNARSRVHEYGGGAMAVHEGVIWFSNDADGRLYTLIPGRPPRALTREGPWRFADLCADAGRRRLLCVREDHSGADEPVNSLVSVCWDTGAVSMLVGGADFYAGPRISADGRWLTYLSWNHPDMPWDATTAWLAELDGSGLGVSARAVAGGRDESIAQPEFDPDGSLLFVSDRSGWWNLHSLREGRVQCVLSERAEFAMPQWQFAMRLYGVAAGGRLVCASTRDGLWRLEMLERQGGARRACPHPLSVVSRVAVEGSQVLAQVGQVDGPAQILRWDLDTDAVQVLRESTTVSLAAEDVSRPEPVDFATGEYFTAHGFFYRPASSAHEGPAGERPPLIVIGHGGPTGATVAAFSLAVQFWTTRGFAVLDVNYRGSTGYGRPYRNALRGEWGVVDVEDCVNGARHLVAAGEVDPQRLIIRGSSAGGYTTLAALSFHDTFRAGASYYGIGELEALARDTHKFESRYLDRLVGPYPEQAQRYRDRSPIHHVQGLSCPVIFFQGLEDKVVPPDQARVMYEALKAKGIPVACLMFEGEQHGFRRAETQIRTLEAELVFYGRVLGFTPAGELPGLEIDNLDGC